MHAKNIRAWQEDIPNIPNHERIPVCSDGHRNLTVLTWHPALSYANPKGLAERLHNLELPEHSSVEPRTLQWVELQGLAINCHRIPAVFFPNGVSRPRRVDIDTGKRYCDSLNQIRYMTASLSHYGVRTQIRQRCFYSLKLLYCKS